MSNFQASNENNLSLGQANHYPPLDGLRGLAILMIILHHNFNFVSFSDSAWISLDLFFVLSGFLITGILLRTRDSVHFMRNFYARRVLRIFPIYYLSLIIFLFILPNLVDFPFSIRYFKLNQSWFWFEIQNWLFIFKPEGNNNYLNHYWSLALEEQFYIVSPWLILYIKSIQRIANLLLSLLILIILIRLALWFRHFQTISYINLYAFTRIDGLCIGSLLAIFKHSGNYNLTIGNRILGAIFSLIVFIYLPVCKFFLDIRLPYTACCLFPMIAMFWGIVIKLSLRAKSVLNQVFSNRVLIFFGKISYGLYIFHWPINRIIRLKLETPHNQVSIALASTCIAIVIATISYYSYERKFLNLKRYFI
jgi:peptidoglycan/LPS O-acetylase OafA/YrhL